ncbi:MAG: class I SAM-dependent methyltransferase family protein [Candidatus Micrarchaeota archaeon]|nr:class I SAM-dependent methyltransferase family protein [Candidatus Micrarchaeota archaeon]
MNIRDLLKEKLTEEEMCYLITSYDVVGNVAIIEIPEEIRDKKKDIAEAIMQIHKNVHNVCMKTGGREGEFRLNKLELIAGSTTKTEHRENGCRMMLDVSKVYYSPRESTERLRITEMVKDGERIMVLFAGVGPYAVVIGKKRPNVEKIYAIEINPDAVECMKDNIRINKLQTKVIPILGDARKESEKYYGTIDRVIMPLPKEAFTFIDIAFLLLKPEGGIIHLYHVEDINTPLSLVEDKIKEISHDLGIDYEIMGRKKVLPYGPRVWKMRIDIKCLNGKK